ncbi:spartin a [Brachionichthys hirsutus]|uniref:spartin a n=1 Tax=Brachionichthys hirsutus TaxID=412623 RepID=UPI003604834A
MAGPAELLLIKDQYELAFHSLSRGLAAEEAGERAEALECYKKGRQHLTQGIEVPTGGERHEGAAWDTARQLQHRMMDTLTTVSSHLADLRTSRVTTRSQRSSVLKNLPRNLYPDLAPNQQPPQSSLHHLYPTVPAATPHTAPTLHKTPPPRPPSPAGVHTNRLAAAGTGAMARPGSKPPPYTPLATADHHSLAYGPAGSGFGSGKQAEADGKELIFIPAGVQMFFVAPNGQVSSLSSTGFLRVMTIDGQSSGSGAFLHVCDWLYPLTRDTPVLLANSGIYMFPDSLAETPGSYVGIVLSSELPAADQELFQDLLMQLVELRIQGPEETGSEVVNLSEKIPLVAPKDQTGVPGKPPVPGWSERMSQGILSGASKLGVKLVKGAEATSRAIHRGGAKIRDNVTPEDTPTEVSPHVHRSLYVVQKATGGAVRVSKFLVDGVSMVMGHVAEKAAPHVKKHGAKLVPESLKKGNDGQPSNLEGAKLVAASSFQGFSTVWTSLETGAKLVGKSVSAETVTNVKYKYGDDAGEATGTALNSAVNIGVTAYNIDNLGLKALMKTAGKETAKAMVQTPKGEPGGTEGKEAQKQSQQQEDQQNKNGKNIHAEEKKEKKK